MNVDGGSLWVGGRGEPLFCCSAGNDFYSRQKLPKESKALQPEENEFISFGHRLKYICVPLPSAKKNICCCFRILLYLKIHCTRTIVNLQEARYFYMAESSVLAEEGIYADSLHVGDHAVQGEWLGWWVPRPRFCPLGKGWSI